MKSLRVREDLVVQVGDSTCEVHGDRGFKMLELNSHMRNFICRLDRQGIALVETEAISTEEAAVLRVFADHGALRIFESDYSRDEIWLSHFVTDARATLAKLGEKQVLIVGCGGTGAIIADHLARAGVRYFTLIDGAELDKPDLNRQFPYSLPDVGQLKVNLLARHLQNEMDCSVRSFAKYIRSESDFDEISGKHDLIICCADYPYLKIQQWILGYADRCDTPVLFGAVGICDQQIGPLLKTADERARERARLEGISAMDLHVSVIKGSNAFSNSIVALKIGALAYGYLIGFEETPPW